MLEILRNKIYRNLLSAQIIALIGTGLATIALGLLAFDLAGGNAGAVLGTALAIKMVAYIFVAPVVGAYADRLPRRAFLVAMDAVRAGVAFMLPFVDQIWQIYLLIFILQSASAAFTPTFQATIPDVLPNEDDYTKALSFSRLAYDLENLLSPMLAAALLSVISFHWLLKTPRLKGLLALTLASAAASAMVIVNTIVIVRDQLGFGDKAVALTLASYGAGSMLSALLLPRILGRFSDRKVMMTAATALFGGLAAMALLTSILQQSAYYWQIVLIGWFVLGIGYSASVTPSGRLLRRSAHAEDRPAIFAAQFALSHGCWLIAYPLAGQVGAVFGQTAAFAILAFLALSGIIAALIFWPAGDPQIVAHNHDDLPPNHPHLREEHAGQAFSGHTYVIDDLHPQWPRG